MLIVDKLDDHIARIATETGSLYVDRNLLHGEIQEGDVLKAHDNSYVRNEAATKARRKHIHKLLIDRLGLQK